MIRRVHLVEPGGRGGVFNHSVQVAAGLTDLGVPTVVHTATDCDQGPPQVILCRCVTWQRASGRRAVRRSVTAARFLAGTLPHLIRVVDPLDVVHVQGLFALTPEVIAVARSRGATVVASPHNTFRRAGAPGTRRALSSMVRRAHHVLVYSAADLAAVRSTAPDAAQVPLVQWTPPPPAAQVRRWRARLDPHGRPLALMPGQVRADKNPDLFVHTLALMPDWHGAIVGDDLGPGRELDRLVAQTRAPVTTAYGYLDVTGFTALVAAADVVVAPYAVASQSGVLAVAANLGVPTAAVRVGGLHELATAVAADHRPESIRDAIAAAARAGAVPVDTSPAAKLFLHEYQVAQRRKARA